MKKLLVILLFAFMLGGYANAETPTYVIDEAATAAASWKVGEIVAERDGSYRRFLGVTTQGHYLVQEFYQGGDIKETDPFRLVNQKDVALAPSENLSIDGPLVTWYIGGEKNIEAMYVNGALQGSLGEWHPNGRKAFEAAFQMNRPVGIWRKWDDQGNLIKEEDYGPAK